MAATLWLAQKPSVSAASKVAFVQPQLAEQTRPDKRAAIILPASRLSAETALPEDREISIVADKIADLPVLKNENAAVEVNPTAGEDADNFLIRAHEFLDSKNFAAALVLYDRVLARDIRNHDALAGKIYAFASGGSTEKAIDASRRLLALYPHDAAAEANLAHLLTQMGKNDEAIAALDSAVRDAPDNLALRLDLAALYDRNGHGTEALMLYRQLADAAGDEDAITLPLASIQRRIAYLERSAGAAAKAPSNTAPVDN